MWNKNLTWKMALFVFLYPFIITILALKLFGVEVILMIEFLFLFHLVAFALMFSAIKKPRSHKIIIYMVTMYSHAVAATISESFSPTANLWPLTLILAPIYAMPIFIFYIVLITLIEFSFCKNDE